MDRALYPDGVLVTGTQLQETETSKQYHIQQRFADSIRAGAVEGLVISIGTVNTRFDFTPGHAYTARGDVVSSPGISNLGLADYTFGAANYICLVYRETPGTPEAYEDGGSTVNTIVTGSSQWKVFTQAEYEALPANASADFATNLDQEDLTQDYKDTVVVRAVVGGKGFTSGSPNAYVTADLTNGTIQQQAAFQTQLTATIPNPASITGVNLKGISSNTNVGQGILMLSGSAGAYVLSWWSPDINGGWNGSTVTGLTPTGTGTFGNSSTVQTFTITTEPHSTANGYAVADTSSDTSTLTVEVYTDLLNQTGLPWTTNVTVTDFYADIGPNFSIQDQLHRSKLGSYVPTAQSPHGMGFPDFVQQVARIPMPIVLGENILASHQEVDEARITIPGTSSGSFTRTHMAQFSGGSYTLRVYKVEADSSIEFVANAKWTDASSIWTRDTTSVKSFKMVLYAGGMALYTYPTSGTTFADTAWLEIWASDSFDVASPLQGLLRFSTEINALNPRVKADYGSGKLLMMESAGSSGGVRLYSNPDYMELVINGIWGGASWSQDNTANPTVRYFFSDAQFKTSYKAAGSGAWSDTAWDDYSTPNLYFNPQNGQMNIAGSFSASGLSATIPAFATSAMGAVRTLVMQVSTTGSGYYRKYVLIPGSGATALVEETFNCGWNGTAWNFDNVSYGPATLIRHGYSGTFQATRSGAGTNWADISNVLVQGPSTGLGGFDKFEWLQGPSGRGLYVPVYNNALSLAPNTLYGDNIVKAYGGFTWNCHQDLTSGVLTLSGFDSFNIASIAPVTPTSTTYLLVTFSQPMALNSYLVISSVNNVGYTGSNGDTLRLQINNQTNTSFQISFCGQDFTNHQGGTNNTDTIANFMVLGLQ